MSVYDGFLKSLTAPRPQREGVFEGAQRLRLARQDNEFRKKTLNNKLHQLELQKLQEERLQKDLLLRAEKHSAMQKERGIANQFKLIGNLNRNNPEAANMLLQKAFGDPMGMDFTSTSAQMLNDLSDTVSAFNDPDSEVYNMSDDEKQVLFTQKMAEGLKNGSMSYKDIRQAEMLKDSLFRSTQPVRAGEKLEQSAAKLFGTSYREALRRDPANREIINTYNRRSAFLRPLSEKKAIELAAYESRLDHINSVLEKIDDPNYARYFGPIRARFDEIKSVFVANEDRETIARQIRSLVSVLYGEAGKQVSDKEFDIAKKAFLPALEQPVGNARAALMVLKEKMAREKENMVKTLYSSGFVLNDKHASAFMRGEEMPRSTTKNVRTFTMDDL